MPALLALLFAMSTTAEAAPRRQLPAHSGWFYANEQNVRVEVDADGRVAGIEAWRTGWIALRMHPGASLEDVRALPEIQALEVLDAKRGIALVDVGPGVDDLVLSRRLHERADVRWAHPDLAFPLTLYTLPDDPYVSLQWHLENTAQDGGTIDADIDAETAWSLTTGAGQVIGVIDSGVDDTHPDLRTTCVYDFIDDTEGCFPRDGNGHGTSAAGLSAASGDNGIGVAGVAYDADILGVRLIGGATSYSDIYRAFRDSVDAGATVLNNSWGFDNGCQVYTATGMLGSALEYAAEDGRGGLGTAVVFSAGNGACDNSGDGILNHPAVIGVGAVDHNDRLEGYSSFGTGVDITAPSGGIVTTDIVGSAGYGSLRGDNAYTPDFSGTSASAPIVSGIVALLFAANPDLTADEAAAILCATADKVSVDRAEYDASGWSESYGCGRVNAGAAVFAVANTRPEAPAVLGPTADTYADAVFLQWAPAVDVDGDHLTYTVTYTRSNERTADTGGGPEEVTVTGITDTFLDLTDTVAIGDTLTWYVVATDAWADSPASSESTFQVVDLPVLTDTAAPTAPALGEAEAPTPEKGGCTTVSSKKSTAMLGFLVLFMVRRRKKSAFGRSSTETSG